MDKHPITPPPELVQQWSTEGRYQDYCTLTESIAAPSAQAVLWAGLNRDSDRMVIAAALRAAAEQLDVTNGECPGVTPFEIGFLKGAARCQKELLAIAAELEGGND